MSSTPAPLSAAAGRQPAGQSHTTCRTVLVVDDSRSQRRILSASLQRWGYRVWEAGSGEDALAILRGNEIHIVLSDWMMPGMDGPELCRRFRQLDREHYGYFILLTSKTGQENVALGLDVGADDFLSKPVAPDELRARIAAGERILKMARELTQKNELLTSTLAQLQAVYDSLDRDLVEARRLQQSLVPERHRDFGRGRMALTMRPSGHVGGDLVGHFRINENRIAFYSLDVSGHGVASALMTARLASYLSGTSPEQNVAISINELGLFDMRAPGQVCAMLNDLLLREMDTDLYFTMILAEVDLLTGRVRFAQAGHPNPAVQSPDGRVRFVGNGGLPIGLIPGAVYETREILLAPGERLLIYSDGLTECVDGADAQLEEAGLAHLMRVSSDLHGSAFLDALVTDLESFAGTVEFRDDVSAVVFEYAGSC
ncbi:PP2C family protein-serine/threonine phosphatase [Roseitranquillus sediminis]|uniref:PP2C family protein-serine/threonine phosphatase n=1 Tax=Roseitranquillus sediminis TaxID=2809051 RepID=UPI001D0C609C|nr:SpoIIE family protein phosphatase [Roseitranquillus sediminis]MBM9593812.1 SpoIIE family protein phosphatase [Roseitranquillus sediminis]